MCLLNLHCFFVSFLNFIRYFVTVGVIERKNQDLFIWCDTDLCFWIPWQSRTIIHTWSCQCDNLRFHHTWINKPLFYFPLIFSYLVYCLQWTMKWRSLQFENKHLLIQKIQQNYRNKKIRISASKNNSYRPYH